jgi:murein peptide amidase A
MTGPGQIQARGRNRGRYCGETIEIDAVLSETIAAAHRHGWTVAEIPAGPALRLPALTRPAAPAQPAAPGRRPRRIYLSSGIHGDEPAGPLAVRHLVTGNHWAPGLDLWLCPCLNPVGFRLNQRENGQGIDLNREYRHPKAPETTAHIEWLDRQPPFDLCLCLHEDWESHGFYVYELNPDNLPSLAQAIVDGAAKVCPIDRSPLIDGRPAHAGIIRPQIDPASRPQWPEAFFLRTRKTKLSYTLEAPSDFPLSVRVAGLVAGTQAALERFGPRHA